MLAFESSNILFANINFMCRNFLNELFVMALRDDPISPDGCTSVYTMDYRIELYEIQGQMFFRYMLFFSLYGEEIFKK